MGEIIKTETGRMIEVYEESGPSSYPSGGFTVNADIGSVTHADSTINDENYHTTHSVANGNEVTIQVYSVGGSSEVSAGTDLSGSDVHAEFFRA